MKEIVIIGAGQLGSRHLQALTLVNIPLNIHLIDPSSASLDKAIDIFTKSAGTQHKVKAYSGIDDLSLKEADVAIVATGSLVRRRAIEDLSAKCGIQFMVLEKFLFPELADYTAIEDLLERKRIKTWVNCPRRMFEVYKDLKKEMADGSVISFSGSLWGLGCNGIHMLDLVAFLTGESEMILSAALLDKNIIKSKREGYIEFTGKITGFTRSGKHNFTLASYSTEGTPFVMSLHTGERNYLISEGGKKQIIFHATPGAEKTEERSFTMLFQSQLTNKVVEQLLSKGSCELTAYSESATLHKQYLNTLLNFMRENGSPETDKCLIT
jgi:predicted dehydrogenase